MVKCPECDSQVAVNDSFCPYCGIALLTAVADDEFASTIIIPPSASADASALSTDARATEAAREPADPAEGDDDSVDLAEPPPMPAILSGLSKTSGNIAQDTSEYNFKTSSGRAPQQKPADSAKAETSLDSPVFKIEAEAASAGTDEVHDSEVGSQSVGSQISQSDAAAAEPETGARDDDTAPRISKPLTELQISPPNSSFDSVRIMEGGAEQDSVNTRIRVEPGPMPAEIVPNDPPPPADAKPPAETGPNIGIDTDGRKSGKLKPLAEGAILNSRYEIVRKIGGGGMGAVYLASDNNLGGVLRAVKEMVQSHIEEEQQAKSVNDFRRESMILSTLEHSSIPTIYDYFLDEAEGRFYLVMKYISGGDLASRLRAAPAGKIDERTVTEWAIQITDVLDYLHNQPSTIVYRDLKPSNLMLDGNSGRVMLIDFGIARSIGKREEKGVTAVGTMGYAPPELFSGNVEPRSDIYSLGSTIFHLLTGADPQSNPLLIFDFQKNPRPRQINPQLSDQMERILMRAVEYRAESRFATAAEMRMVLVEHLENLKAGRVTFGVSEAPASVSLANQAVFCGFCGQRIVATDLFCAFCGSKQPIAQQGVHSEIYAKPSATAKLVVEGTSELTTPTFSLQKDENLLGRRDPMSNIFPEVDLSKYDPQTKISRRHARIWREAGQFMVEDLGSSNGTMVVSAVSPSIRLMPLKPHKLASGDKIKIGDTTLHFIVG